MCVHVCIMCMQVFIPIVTDDGAGVECLGRGAFASVWLGSFDSGSYDWHQVRAHQVVV